jgi:proteasome lid subunit RPN8/RPN11
MTRPLHSAQRRPFEPCLSFAPLPWLKLAFFCHQGDTEIGGFGISAPNNLLYVEDLVTLKQQVTSVSVRFLDDAVADHFDHCLERGLPPARCGRLWFHTHPGDSALPSSTDEETFVRSFGSCDWAVMFILARSGHTYARLAFAAGPKAQMEIPVTVDWSAWPACLGKDKPSLDMLFAQWRQEYEAHVQPLPPPPRRPAAMAFPSDVVDVAWGCEERLFLPCDPLDPLIDPETLLYEFTDYAYFE